MKFCAACLTLICALPAVCAAAQLTGTVRSKAGTPLAGVVLISRCRGAAETDAGGSFRLRAPSMPDCGKVIFIWAAGFIPQLKIVDEATKEIHVVLEETAGRERTLPPCSEVCTRGKRLGWMLRVPVPRGASVKKGSGPHGPGWSVKIRGGKRWIELTGYGGQLAYIHPSDDLILNASEITIHAWRSGLEEGVDFRGRSSDGTRWRNVAIFGEDIKYSAVTAEEAYSLDSIIDGICFQPAESS